MKHAFLTTSLTAALLALGIATAVQAEPAPDNAAEHTNAKAPAPTAGQTPQMSEIPVMKQQGERMAVLMEQLSKESDPEVRRRIMAEAVCPQ